MAVRSLPLFALLSACGGGESGRIAVAPAAVDAADWRLVATPSDRERLRNWRQTWLAATGAARAGDGGAMAAEGVLFQPDRALADAVPPSGRYRCRVFKLGARSAFTPAFTAYPFFGCRIDDDGTTVSFSKDSGSQRPVGLIFRDGPARGVFLGTMMLGDEARAIRYGRDPARDMAGFVERVGERRWRIVLPEPRFESRLDVVELVPTD